MVSTTPDITSDPFAGIDESIIWNTIHQFQAEQKQAQKEINKLLKALEARKVKTCKSCHKVDGEVRFHKNNLRRDGLQAYCITCMKNKRLAKEKADLAKVGVF